jgi:hypothetical protein
VYDRAAAPIQQQPAHAFNTHSNPQLLPLVMLDMQALGLLQQAAAQLTAQPAAQRQPLGLSEQWQAMPRVHAAMPALVQQQQQQQQQQEQQQQPALWQQGLQAEQQSWEGVTWSGEQQSEDYADDFHSCNEVTDGSDEDIV